MATKVISESTESVFDPSEFVSRRMREHSLPHFRISRYYVGKDGKPTNDPSLARTDINGKPIYSHCVRTKLTDEEFLEFCESHRMSYNRSNKALREASLAVLASAGQPSSVGHVYESNFEILSRVNGAVSAIKSTIETSKSSNNE